MLRPIQTPPAGPVPPASAPRLEAEEACGPGAAHAVTEAFEREVRAGADPQAAEQRLARMARALTARIKPFDFQTVPVFDVYRDRFAGGPDAEAGANLLSMLASRRIMGDDAAALAAAVAEPLGDLPLEGRSALLGEVLEAVGPGAAPSTAATAYTLLRQEGNPSVPGAVARVKELVGALEGAGLKQGWQQKPVLDACGRHAAEAPALVPGWPARLLRAHVPADEVALAMEEAASTLGPLLQAGGDPLAAEVQRLMAAPLGQPWKEELALLRDTLAVLTGPRERTGGIEEQASEIVIGDVRLPRREA